MDVKIRCKTVDQCMYVVYAARRLRIGVDKMKNLMVASVTTSQNSKHWKFNTLEHARSFRNQGGGRHGKALAIVLGDETWVTPKFWVVTIAEMERLVRAGFQVLK